MRKPIIGIVDDGRIKPRGPLPPRRIVEEQMPATEEVRSSGTEPSSTPDVDRAALAMVQAPASPVVAAELGRAALLPAGRRRLDSDTRRGLQVARDQNVDALMARHARQIISGPNGLFRQLNPDEHDLEIDGVLMNPTQQRYALLDTLTAMLRAGYREDDAGVLAARYGTGSSAHPEAAQSAMVGFLTDGRRSVDRVYDVVGSMARPADMTPSDVTVVADRLSLVRWLQREAAEIDPHADAVVGAEVPFKQDLDELLSLPDHEEVLEALDARFETVMNWAVEQSLEQTGLKQLDTVRFDRLKADTKVLSPAALEAQRCSPEHDNYRWLGELRGRLERGEVSAIGGPEYALQRFPKEVLDRAAAGDVGVIVYDGSRDHAIDYVRSQYGSADGVRQQCRIMGLTGLDGSGPRMLMTFEDGRQFLVVAGMGESRQLHNAGGLLLYEDDAGRRIPTERLELVRQDRDLKSTMRQDIDAALSAEKQGRMGSDILGHSVHPKNPIPTQLVILQHPRQLAQFLGDKFAFVDDLPAPDAVPFSVAFGEVADQLVRFVMPKVGGSGLYGDTAGAFVEAFFTRDADHLNRHVLFNGTAGGFAGQAEALATQGIRGLGDVRPGGLIIPTQTIEQLGEQVMPMVSMVGNDPEAWPDELRAVLDRAKANLTDRHIAVKAPAVETHELVEEIVAGGNASIDVEGGYIQAAIRQLHAAGLPVTFTPVYTHSDDPTHSRVDRTAALSYLGPWFEEAGGGHNELMEVLHSFMKLSYRRKNDELIRGDPTAGS